VLAWNYETAMSFGNLAALLHDQGDLAGACPLYERAMAIADKVLGTDHQNTSAPARSPCAHAIVRHREIALMTASVYSVV
jgi:hypothetical protein